MNRPILAVLLAFLTSMALSAVPMTVSWADGKVDLQKGSSWAPVNIGDKLDSASTLRLGAGATAELTGAQRKISLTAAGTYNIDAMLKQGEVGKKTTGVLDKVGKLVDPKAQSGGNTTIAGVRGAAVEPTKDSISWLSDSVDIDALMEEGRTLLRNQEFSAAAVKFSEAADAAEGDQLDAASYAQAWALASDGSVARAVKILRTMPASGPWAAPRALLLARLDIDSSAKAEAKAVLTAAKTAKLFVGDDVALAEALLAEASSN